MGIQEEKETQRALIYTGRDKSSRDFDVYEVQGENSKSFDMYGQTRKL